MSKYQKEIDAWGEEQGLQVSEERGTYYFVKGRRRFRYQYYVKIPNNKGDGGLLRFVRNIHKAVSKEWFKIGYQEGYLDGVRQGEELERARIAKIMKSRVDTLLDVDTKTEKVESTLVTTDGESK